MAVEEGVGYVLSYFSTKLDDNGVPVNGDSKDIVLSKIDIVRLESILDRKLAMEERVEK